MYKCIIIDDESHAIEGLDKYIDSFPDLQLVASYTDPIIALKEINAISEPIDLILLDIDMPQMNGIELSRVIRKKTNKLVFTTGHTKYGYEAFQVEADAYLLKPYTLGDFVATMDKLFPQKKQESPGTKKSDYFLVKSKEDNLKLVTVRCEDIVVIESKLNYIMIHTKNKKIMTYMSLTEISKILSGHPGFLQFQRSYIISQDHIEYIDGNSIKMTNGMDITVGDYYRKEFTKFVNEKLIKPGKKNKPSVPGSN
jgi:two-component system response regulator LytT